MEVIAPNWWDHVNKWKLWLIEIRIIFFEICMYALSLFLKLKVPINETCKGLHCELSINLSQSWFSWGVKAHVPAPREVCISLSNCALYERRLSHKTRLQSEINNWHQQVDSISVFFCLADNDNFYWLPPEILTVFNLHI